MVLMNDGTIWATGILGDGEIFYDLLTKIYNGDPIIQPIPIPFRVLMTSLFTDNSRVYYKPGSLASCGVGSTRNARHKSRMT
jgi:hypothetical protein